MFIHDEINTVPEITWQQAHIGNIYGNKYPGGLSSTMEWLYTCEAISKSECRTRVCHSLDHFWCKDYTIFNPTLKMSNEQRQRKAHN